MADGQHKHDAGGWLTHSLEEHLGDNPELRLTLFAPVAEADSILRFRHLVESFANGDGANEPRPPFQPQALQPCLAAILVALK